MRKYDWHEKIRLTVYVIKKISNFKNKKWK